MNKIFLYVFVSIFSDFSLAENQIPKCDDRIELGTGKSIVLGTINWHPFGSNQDRPFLSLLYVKDKLGWRHFRNYIDLHDYDKSVPSGSYQFKDDIKFIGNSNFTISDWNKKIESASFSILPKPDPATRSVISGVVAFPAQKINSATWPKRVLAATSNGTYLDPENWKIEKKTPKSILEVAANEFSKIYPQKFYCKDFGHAHDDRAEYDVKKLPDHFSTPDLKIVKTYVSKDKKYVVGIIWKQPGDCGHVNYDGQEIGFTNSIGQINWFYINNGIAKHMLANAEPIQILDVDQDGSSEWLFSNTALFSEKSGLISIPTSYDRGCS